MKKTKLFYTKQPYIGQPKFWGVKMLEICYNQK